MLDQARVLRLAWDQCTPAHSAAEEHRWAKLLVAVHGCRDPAASARLSHERTGGAARHGAPEGPGRRGLPPSVRPADNEDYDILSADYLRHRRSRDPPSPPQVARRWRGDAAGRDRAQVTAGLAHPGLAVASLPTWAVLLVSIGTPMSAFAGVIIGQLLLRKGATELDTWRRREETMRMLRWASEQAASDSPAVARMGVGWLCQLDLVPG